jgi:hypothetical protein
MLALLLPQQPTVPRQPEHRFRIVVVDSEGAEVGKAHAILHADSPAVDPVFPDRILDMDVHEKINLSVPDGFYDLCIMSSGFSPACRKILMQGHDAKFVLRLKVSGEMVEHLGDNFPIH